MIVATEPFNKALGAIGHNKIKEKTWRICKPGRSKIVKNFLQIDYPVARPQGVRQFDAASQHRKFWIY